VGYDIEAIRAQVKAKLKKGKDPTEFRAPKVEIGQSVKFKFYILPPLQAGDACNDGKTTCEHAMELFAIPNGAHYIDNKRMGCPRIINEEECAICQYAFDLMSEVDSSTEEGKKQRSKIARDLLPGQYHLVNLYFPPVETNAEELRGKVFWWNAPKTVVDMWLECLYRDDDGGDPDDPLAFGVFFDECNAYQFQLEVNKDGQMVNYKKSKFIGGKKPIATDKATKKLDAKRIKEILAKRHNLWEKMPQVDMEEINRVANSLAGNVVSNNSSGFDQDEDAMSGEVVEEAPVAKPVAKAVAKPAAKAVAKPAAVAAAKPAATVATKTVTKTAAVAAKPATKTVAKPVKKPEPEPESELEEEVEELESEVEQELDDLAGEAPAEETEEAQTEEEAPAEETEEAGVDDEVDRLLGELQD
jgi:hypothetical protein